MICNESKLPPCIGNKMKGNKISSATEKLVREPIDTFDSKYLFRPLTT